MAALEQGQDHLAAGVVGIGNQQHGLLPQSGPRQQERHHPVQQRALIAVGEDQAFVDPGGQRHRRHGARDAAYQQGNGLERMAHDVGRLGVAAAGLIQAADSGHLLAFFADLDAVGQTHQVVPDPDRREQFEYETGPHVRQSLQVQGRVVKLM